MKRRSFLQKSISTSTVIAFQSSAALSTQLINKNSEAPKLTFGIVADAHHGMLPDINDRLSSFIEEAFERKVDFIVQLGDFCHSTKKSSSFLEIWNQFSNNKYHVLGNHDMDLGTKSEAMDLWGMPQKYYTFDEGGIRFIVLDANYLYADGKYHDYGNSNFYVDDSRRTYINPEQIEWLKQEITSSNKPLIILTHQSLWHYQYGIKNRLEIQKILEANSDKIICCLNGHNHIDFHHIQNGIHYLDINSMSYHWIGGGYRTSNPSPELLSEYKWLDHMSTYRDPLYAFASVSVDYTLKIEGVRSEWNSPSPAERGVPKQVYGNRHSPEISDFTIRS